jgi:hypothetical protein
MAGLIINGAKTARFAVPDRPSSAWRQARILGQPSAGTRTSDFLPWCFPGLPAGQYRAAQWWNARRAAARFAERVNGRDQREAIWRLKDGFY